jgi:hypothetical protein
MTTVAFSSSELATREISPVRATSRDSVAAISVDMVTSVAKGA